MKFAWIAIGAALAAASLSATASAAADGRTACKPSVSAVAIRYCGHAIGTLSVFGGIKITGGTCVMRNGTFSMKLGARSMKNPLKSGGTNSRLAYYELSVSGPLASPVGGGVIVFWKGQHWYGRGVSFKGDTHSGTFVAQGIAARGSHGTATGTYQC